MKTIINIQRPSNYKKEQLEDVLWVMDEIKKLPLKIQKLILQGKEVIEGHLKTNKSRVDELNVFNLTDNIPGDVMKYLVMLYEAAGYDARILGDFFESDGIEHRVKYPNQITLIFRK